jgi:tRNA-(ms[2]io[6]A)-hydroxylase
MRRATSPTAISLRCATSPEWVPTVLADFDTFLVDHAACERKASATGMLFVVRYPDRPALIGPLIDFAREELEHFHEVWKIVSARGLQLRRDRPDDYARALLEGARHGRDERLLDRLLIAGILEARGCERFGLLSNALEEEELHEFYRDLVRADARHQRLFFDLAREYFDDDIVRERSEVLLELEADIVTRLPVRPALY